MTKSAIVWIDGASRGNPGPSGIGVHIEKESGGDLAEISEYLGEDITNNQAEYNAMIRALEKCIDMDFNNIELRSDSQLLIRQMKGQYEVKSSNLRDLYTKGQELASKFDNITYEHISREKNTIADKLANKAIDQTE